MQGTFLTDDAFHYFFFLNNETCGQTRAKLTMTYDNFAVLYKIPYRRAQTTRSAFRLSASKGILHNAQLLRALCLKLKAFRLRARDNKNIVVIMGHLEIS